jgi:DTW domain-containing protein
VIDAGTRDERPFCYACRRAQVLCVCSDVAPISTRTRLVFLQHEEEAWNQIGTARLCHLALPNSLLLEGRDFKEDERLARALEGAPETLLLWPTRDAASLDEFVPGQERVLVVIDGTWSQARNLYNHTPILKTLRRVKLPRGEKSRYRIRLQPRGECVSSLEAAVRALGALEGDAARFDPILRAFDRMIDKHIDRAKAAGRQIFRDLRAERAKRPLPSSITGDIEKLVIVHGETLNRLVPATGGYKADLVQWTALRLGTGEQLDITYRSPDRALGASELEYLGLPSLEDALEPEAFKAAWNAFTRPGDHYVAWGYYAANALAAILGRRPHPETDLRRATKHVLNRKVQRPEDGLFELDLPAPAPLARGRCGARLAAVKSIVTELRAMRGLPMVGAGL